MLLNCLFLVLAIISTVGIYLGVPTLHLGWILPIFVGSFVGAVIVFLLLLFIVSLFLPKKEPVETPKRWCARMIYLVMDFVMRWMRVQVSLTGAELLPDEPCILVSNHRSDFDPMTVLAVVKNKRISYISKQSNFKIPIVGSFIWHAGFLAIDRGNGVRAVHDYGNYNTAKKKCQEKKREIF